MFLFSFLRETDRDRATENEQGMDRERETQNLKQAPGSELSAQSRLRGLTHGPRDRDLAEVGRLTDCATQAPQYHLYS